MTNASDILAVASGNKDLSIKLDQGQLIQFAAIMLIAIAIGSFLGFLAAKSI